MGAPKPPSNISSANAEVRDVFGITGRGTVVTVAHIENVIHIGDQMTVGDGTYVVKGIEMLKFAEPSNHPSDTVGILIDCENIDLLRKLAGTRATFRRPA